MATLYNADLKPLGAGVSTHPYQHATRLFLDDNYRLAPKQSFLYYVCINIDSGILQSINSILSGSFSENTSSQTISEQYEAGLLAKKVDLPKFTLTTKTMNAYNRKNIIQTGITYDPINITFHDDTADVVTTFWNDYYTYYYRDSDYDATLYQVPHKYQPRLREGWGFSPRNQNLKPFLRNIQIFSLHNKRFTEYLLINPFITSWRHGEHNAVGDTGIMENNMTLAYETVKYRTGYVNPVDVNGFAILHYDNTNSPISTSITNIYSDAGGVGALAGQPTDLARPDGTTSGAGVFGSLLNAYRFYNNVKNANWGSLAKVTLGSLGVSVINGAINGAVKGIFFPTSSGVPGYGGNASGSQVAVPFLASSFSPYGSPLNSSGISINGIASSLTSSLALNFNNSINTTYTRGVNSNLNGPPPYGSGQVYDVQNNNGTITVNPGSGQPVTGTYTAQTIGVDGSVVGSRSVAFSGTGGYNSNNPDLNAKTTEIIQDQSGQVTLQRTYLDGSVITFDNSNNVLNVVPGDGTAQLPAPINARNAAANGSIINPSSPQYYTDPRTGITQTVNGGTPGQVTNFITGATGTAAGLYAGYEVNQYLGSTFLGKSVIGRTVSAGISAYTGKVVGTAVNNGLQPIVNSVTGAISQGFDSVTGKIKNVVSSWTGTGGYNPSKPTENVVSVTTDELGNKTTTYRDGTMTNVDPSGVESIVNKGSSQNSYSDFFGKTPGSNTDSVATIRGSSGYGGVVTDSWGNPIQGINGPITYGDGPMGPPTPTSGLYEITPITVPGTNQGIFASDTQWNPGPVNTDTLDPTLAENLNNNDSNDNYFSEDAG